MIKVLVAKDAVFRLRYASLRCALITWLSTRTLQRVMIVTKFLKSMVPARGFEPLAP